MGLQKTSTAGTETRLNKSHSVNLYLPPALRNLNQANGATGNNSTSVSSETAVAIATTAVGTAICSSIINANTTTTSCAIATTTSILCSNSPTYGNKQYCRFDNTANSTVAAMTTVSTATISMTAPTMTATVADCSAQKRQQQQNARRERRPDRAVYIPRARRSQTTPPKTTAAAIAQTVTTTINHNQQFATAVVESVVALVSAGTSSTADGNTSASDTSNTTVFTVPTSTAAEKKAKSSSTRDCKERSITSPSKDIKSSASSESVKTICNSAFGSRTALEHCEQEQRNVQNRTVPIMASKRNMASATVVNGSLINDGVIVTHMLRIEHVAAAAEAADVCERTPSKWDIDEQELKRASQEINRSNRRIIKQTFASDILEIPDKIERCVASTAIVINTKENCANHQTPPQPSSAQRITTNGDSTEEEEDEDDCTGEDDWETLFDESGECLDPKIMEELTASVGKVKIDLPKMDYSAYLTKQTILNDEEFPHVLEVSNFPVEFKNQDLLMVFSQYKESGFDIKWVDETHALAVFSSSRIAAEVLTMGHPFVVVKPLSEATVESRLKAKKCAASLQPYRPRPETCAALARRLVTGALGVRLKTAAAERENEKRVLREAKERKLLAAKQRDEVWES